MRGVRWRWESLNCLLPAADCLLFEGPNAVETSSRNCAVSTTLVGPLAVTKVTLTNSMEGGFVLGC